MCFPWGNATKLIVASLVGLAASHSYSSISITNYKQGDIITRDVCIIGGGSTGTYSAVRLGDFNKSVIVVEMKGRLGGHTETYIDPPTQIPVDYHRGWILYKALCASGSTLYVLHRCGVERAGLVNAVGVY